MHLTSIYAERKREVEIPGHPYPDQSAGQRSGGHIEDCVCNHLGHAQEPHQRAWVGSVGLMKGMQKIRMKLFEESREKRQNPQQK